MQVQAARCAWRHTGVHQPCTVPARVCLSCVSRWTLCVDHDWGTCSTHVQQRLQSAHAKLTLSSTPCLTYNRWIVTHTACTVCPFSQSHLCLSDVKIAIAHQLVSLTNASCLPQRLILVSADTFLYFHQCSHLCKVTRGRSSALRADEHLPYCRMGWGSSRFNVVLTTGNVGAQMMKVELTKWNKRFGVAKLAGKAYVGSELACEADLTLIMAR